MRLINADALKEHLDYVCVGGGKWGDAEKAFINAFKDFVDGEITIQLEPKSAQQWIPCSERLPETQEDVLCDDDGWVTIGYYTDEEVGWHDKHCYRIYPTAWMPLPKPWKGEEG